MTPWFDGDRRGAERTLLCVGRLQSAMYSTGWLAGWQVSGKAWRSGLPGVMSRVFTAGPHL